MEKFIRAKYIRTNKYSSISLGAFYSQLVEVRQDPTTRKRTRAVHEPVACTTIVSSGGAKHESLPEGQTLAPGDFMVQDIKENYGPLTDLLKKEYIILDDIDLENKLLDRDAVVEETIVKAGPVIIEEEDLTIKDSPSDVKQRKEKNKKLMADMKSKNSKKKEAEKE